jgi:hypothetical protein
MLSAGALQPVAQHNKKGNTAECDGPVGHSRSIANSQDPAPANHQTPVFGIDFQGSFGGSASPS